MTHRLRLLGSASFLITALLFLLATQVWAQGPEGLDDEYIVYLQSSETGAETARTWFWTRRILSALQANGLVHQFELAEEENILFVTAGREGLYQLQELEWVVRIERQTDLEPEAVRNAQQVKEAARTAPLAPNTVTGIVDLPDGTPVSGQSVRASEVDGWGSSWESTDTSGAYTMTLSSDGWWDIYLDSSIPGPYSNDYARPLDWERRLYITSDIVENFTLIPISYTITGTVRVTGTGELVQWETVRGTRMDGGHDDTDFTDSSGLYQLDVTTGTYTVTVGTTSQSDGYAPPFEGGEIVDVPGASVGGVDLWVLPLDKVITGTVTDKDTGEPIGDVGLDVDRTDGLYQEHNIRTETSGLTGTYVVSVTSGVYEVSLDTWGQPAGYALPVTDTQIVTVTDSNKPNVNFQLLPLNKHIRGRVTDKDTGDGISGVNMSISAISGEPESYNAATDSSGYYTFTATEGVYDVSLPWSPPSGYALPVTDTQRVTITTSGVSDVDFQLIPFNKHIRGRVTDKDTGGGISGVNMSITAISGQYESYNVTTDSSGYYTFTVTEGEYDVRLPWSPPIGYARPPTTTKRVVVTTSDVSEVDFVLLPKNKSIGGRVTVRGTDTGVGGVQMYISGEYVYTDTTTTGYYTFTHLAEGNYTVYVDDVPAGYAAYPPTNRQVELTTTSRSGIDFEVLAADRTIRGTVREAGGSGIAGVGVRAYSYDTDYTYNPDTTTDASGAYTFTVPAGYFDVRVTLPSGYAGRLHLRAWAGANSVDFDLPKRSETITGQVTDHQGTPLGDVYMYADNHACYDTSYSRDNWNGHDSSTYADASGYYTLTVIAGSYEVRATKTGYATPPYQDAQSGDGDVNFTMPEGFLIQGQVWTTAAAGGTAALPTAYVRAYNTAECASSRHTQDTTADANGYYTLTVDTGTYSVSASQSGYESAPAQSVTVGPDRSGVDFELSPLYHMTGTVRYPNGQPVFDARVHTTAGPTYDSDWTDTHGRYELRVSPGTYNVAADIENWPDPDTITGVAVVTDTYGVDFTAPDAYTVTGTVRRSDGTPWNGIGVYADQLEPPYEYEWDWPTDADGLYALHVRQGGTYLFYPDEWVYPANPAPISYTVNADMSGVDFQFRTVVTVSGMVSDTLGTPVPNAEVDIDGYGTNGAWNWDETYSFYDGTYVGFLAEGSYDGIADKGSCYVSSGWRSFTLGTGGTSGVDFTIARNCSAITGRVTDEQDDPICDAEVDIRYPSGGWLDAVFTAEDQHGQTGIGTYRALVPIGTWNLTASKQGYQDVQPVLRTVEITMCNTLVTGQDFQFVTAKFVYLPLVLRNH